MKNKGMKKFLSILIAFGMIAGSLMFDGPMIVNATEQSKENKVDLDRQMTLQVGINSGAEHYFEELREEDGTIVYDLYKLADVVPSGNVFKFEVNSMFSELEDELAKASTSYSGSDKINYSEFAQIALADIIGTEGTFVNESGKAAYSGLSLKQANEIEEGLYLLVARGSLENTTVVKSVNVNNSDRADYALLENGLVTYTLLGSTYFTISPQIVCAPTKISENGTILDDNMQDGNWVYDQSIVLKMLEDPATGSIQIDKVLSGYYGDAENATFVFRVDTYFPTEMDLFSSEVYSLQFTSPGTKSLIVEGLPIGSTVKVYEIYSGNNYTASIAYPDSIDVVIADSQTPVVTFSNTYNKRTSGGGGVTNHFSYAIKEGIGSWIWEKIGDNTITSNGLSTRLLQMILNAVKDNAQ